MQVELWGGPHDGHQLNVPEHIYELRIPIIAKYGDELIPGLPATAHLIAHYARVTRERDGAHEYVFRYTGQDQYV